MCAQSLQSCLTLCNLMDCSPPAHQAPLSMGFSRQEPTGVGCHCLLQGIFPTQGSNLHLLRLLLSRQIFLPLSHLGPECNWLPQWLGSNESTYQCRRRVFGPWVRKIPWRRKWQPTLVFLPGKSHGLGSLVGYSPWGSQNNQI